MDRQSLINDFTRDMKSICRRLSRECNYKPAFLLKMIWNEGALKTAKSIIAGKQIIPGLQRLTELNRLDLSIEALVLQNKYKELFEPDELEICRKKLEENGYLGSSRKEKKPLNNKVKGKIPRGYKKLSDIIEKLAAAPQVSTDALKLLCEKSGQKTLLENIGRIPDPEWRQEVWKYLLLKRTPKAAGISLQYESVDIYRHDPFAGKLKKVESSDIINDLDDDDVTKVREIKAVLSTMAAQANDLQEALNHLLSQLGGAKSGAKRKSDYIFRKGRLWTLYYKGCADEIRVRNSVNLPYIACLLYYPNREFYALELENLARKKEQPMESATGPAINLLKKKRYLHLLQKNLREAEQDNDSKRIDMLDGKIKQLMEEIKQELSSQERKIKGKVDGCIRRALEEIEEASGGDLKLYNHLKAHLKPIRFPISYNPDRNISWDVEF